MSTFNVQGNFVAEADVPANTLSGTIDISAGQLTALDLAVPGFASHFTEIWFNEYFNGSWLVSAFNANNDPFSVQDYLNVFFVPTPGPYLIGFEQARIVNGYVDTFQIAGTLTYYGLALGGTICPPAGCAPFPTHSAPGPVAGEGLVGLAFVLCVLWSRLRK